MCTTERIDPDRNTDKLICRIQEEYGQSREQVERQLEEISITDAELNPVFPCCCGVSLCA